MPYNSGTGAYERRATTVIDATPDGDTVAVAIDVKLDQGIDDYVVDLNHHNTNGRHYPATSTHTDSRFLKQSPAGSVTWADGVPAPDAALKDFSNVASGAIAPAKVAQDASNRFMTDAERAKVADIGQGISVSKSSTQTITVNTETKVTWDTEGWDDYAAFSGNDFVAPEDGRYFITASLCFGSMESGRLWVRIKVNGVIVTHEVQSGAGTSDVTGRALGVLQLSAGDVVNIYALAGGTINRTILNNTSTYFQIHRL